MSWKSSFPTLGTALKPILWHQDDTVDRYTLTTDDEYRGSLQPSSPSSVPSGSHKQIVITHILVNDIALGLGRMPVGFFIIVEAEGNQWRTRNKPILLHDHSMGWDDEIYLPLELLSDVRLRVCASFELSPVLGNGETLWMFAINIGELFDDGETTKCEVFLLDDTLDILCLRYGEAIEITRHESKPTSPCSTLVLKVERRSKELNVITPVSNRQNNTSNSEDSPTLAQITDRGHENLLRYHKDHNPEDLKRSISFFERALKMCSVTHQCYAVVLFNLATARLISSQDGITSPDFDVPIALYRDALDLRPVGHPDRPITLLHLARASASHFLRWDDESYAEEAEKLIAEVLDVCSPDSYEYQLANIIHREFTSVEVTRTVALSPRSVGLESISKPNKNAIIQAPDRYQLENAELYVTLSTLPNTEQAGQKQANVDGIFIAVDKAIRLAQEAYPEQAMMILGPDVEHEISTSMSDASTQHYSDGHLDHTMGFAILGNVILAHSIQLRQTEDLDKSISFYEKALGLVTNDDPDRSIFVSMLSAAYLIHFLLLRNAAYLDKAISLMEEAVLCPPRDGTSVFLLTDCLKHLYGTANLPESATTSIKDRKILIVNRLVHHQTLLMLGHALHMRFERSGAHTDLDNSISMKREALKLASSDRSSYLANLSGTLIERYNHTRDIANLNESIFLLAEAVRLTPNHHPQYSERLVQLGSLHHTRFIKLGKVVDIDQAVSLKEEAVHCTPDYHAMKASWLAELGCSLYGRFHFLRISQDLEKTNFMAEKSVRLTPLDHPDRLQRLLLLGVSFNTRFEQTGRLSDLEKSISALEEVAKFIPDGPEPLSRLAYALNARSKLTGSTTDLEKSISLACQAVQFTKVNDSELPSRLTIAAVVILRRFELSGDPMDHDKSTSLMIKALRITPEGHPTRSILLFDTGSAFMVHYHRLGSISALRTAISYYSAGARAQVSTQPDAKFKAFKQWFQCAVYLRRESPREAEQTLLEAFKCGIDLFPQIAWMGLAFKDRYARLSEAADITQTAASLAVSLGNVAQAVEWLEQGRCVVWGQLLQLHTPLDQLRLVRPDLADELERISNTLEQCDSHSNESLFHFALENDRDVSSEQQARRHRELAAERENIIKQVQALPGFERLFLPKKFDQLRAAAHSGPIVLLTVTPKGSHALIVVSDLDKPVHVPLLDINESQVDHLHETLKKLLSNDGRVISRDEVHRAARPVPRDGQSFSHILSELWIKVVKPVLHALGLTTPGNPIRVFWCPTGGLSFLPIHAAGNYESPGPGNKASDFIISSYIPTLSVLDSPRERPAASNNIRLLAVLQPSSDGQAHLSGARDEIEHIRTAIGRFSSTHAHLYESIGSVEGVLDGMEQSDWVHFACHGIQDPENPTDSGLCLADGRRLRLSDIIRLSRPRAGLAFLSACQTATGAVELSDEAVHLSAGMLFAGYSSVIGTMWSIRDSVAPRLARDVYEQLFRDGRVPDSREAARALHDAVGRLRDNGEPFVAWVPFIHMGI